MLGSVLVVGSVSENGRRSLGSGLLSAKIAGGLARSKIGRVWVLFLEVFKGFQVGV